MAVPGEYGISSIVATRPTAGAVVPVAGGGWCRDIAGRFKQSFSCSSAPKPSSGGASVAAYTKRIF